MYMYVRMCMHVHVCTCMYTATDYDAPLNEYGSATQKYIELRNVLSQMVPESMSRYPLPPLPSPVIAADYGSVKMTLYISLMSTLQYVPVSIKV